MRNLDAQGNEFACCVLLFVLQSSGLQYADGQTKSEENALTAFLMIDVGAMMASVTAKSLKLPPGFLDESSGSLCVR